SPADLECRPPRSPDELHPNGISGLVVERGSGVVLEYSPKEPPTIGGDVALDLFAKVLPSAESFAKERLLLLRAVGQRRRALDARERGPIVQSLLDHGGDYTLRVGPGTRGLGVQ